MIRWIRLLAVALAAPGVSAAADGGWLRTLPGDGRSGCCHGLAADPQGGAWFLGNLPGSGPVDVDGTPRTARGGSDALLLHVTGAGRIDRSLAIGGAGSDFATELAVDGDGSVYAVVRFGAGARVGDVLVTVPGPPESALLRFDPSGRCRWGVELPGTGEEGARALAIDPSGGIVVAGTFVRVWSRGDVPEIYVTRYAADGARSWQRRCEGTGRALAVDADAGGNVYLGTASPARERGDGRLAEDGWPLVQCIGPSGGLRWSWEPGREGADAEAWGRVVAVAADPEGGCRVLGEVEGLVRIGDAVDPGLRGRDVFLARLGANGETLWIERFGGPGDDAAFDLARADHGACIVTGAFRATARLDPWTLRSDAPSAGYVARWDDNGSCEWAGVLEGPGVDPQEVLPYEVAAAPDGAVWVSGWFRTSVRIADLDAQGPPDAVFLLRVLAGGRTR